MSDELMTVDEVAKYLRIERQTLYAWRSKSYKHKSHRHTKGQDVAEGKPPRLPTLRGVPDKPGITTTKGK